MLYLRNETKRWWQLWLPSFIPIDLPALDPEALRVEEIPEFRQLSLEQYEAEDADIIAHICFMCPFGEAHIDVKQVNGDDLALPELVELSIESFTNSLRHLVRVTKEQN